MSSDAPIPSVADNEWLARFILFSGWIRGSKTVKPDAFIPPPNLDLSVTRHKELTKEQLWQVGREIADSRSVPVTLHGRADITAAEVRRQKLEVEPRPVPENLNHASVIGWPTDKPAQKILAQELAAVARYVARP
jgi:hypothetical protein